MGHDGPVESSGKHAGKRRAEPAPSHRPGEPSERSRAKLLALALGVTLAIVAWGYLVYAAIDFGSEARGGDSSAWCVPRPRVARAPWPACSWGCCWWRACCGCSA